MKKLYMFILVFLVITQTYAMSVSALSPTSSPTKAPAPSAQDSESLSEKIDHLKSVLASKVAELKLVDKRGIIGTVQDTSTTQMTLIDTNTNTRLIDVDEITKFSSSSASGTFGISDVKKGMKVSVFGLYNKESKRILARFVETVDTPLYVSGTITDVDKINYLITLMQSNGTAEKVDIENLTKMTTYNEDLDPTKIGYSKVVAGTRAVVVGYADPKEKNRLTASRILLFSALPKDPKITVSISDTPEPSSTPIPSTIKKKVTP